MGKTVLVVDDDPVVRILVSEYLTAQGYSVEALESGGACLDRLAKSLPDIVVLDLMMPEMSGIEVLQRIRSNPSTNTLPIIMLSADQDSSTVASAHHVSADSYVQKPFGMRDILGALENISEVKS